MNRNLDDDEDLSDNYVIHKIEYMKIKPDRLYGVRKAKSKCGLMFNGGAFKYSEYMKKNGLFIENIRECRRCFKLKRGEVVKDEVMDFYESMGDNDE